MKIEVIILQFFLCTCCIFNLSGQITIRENGIVENAVLKPKSFDSLSNLVLQNRVIDFKKYIGYKLFFLSPSNKYENSNPQRINYLFIEDTVQIVKEGKIPFEQVRSHFIWGDGKKVKGAALEQYKSLLSEYENIDKAKTNIYNPHFFYEKTDIYDGEIYGEIATSPESIIGKYFTILNITGKDIHDKKNNYLKLEDIEIETSRIWSLGLKFMLRNDSNSDTLFWIVNLARDIGDTPFFLVPYFEKQKQTYLNQNLSAMKNFTDLIDINSGQQLIINSGDVWNCYDISFTNSKTSMFLKPYYFLRKGNNEITFDLDALGKNTFILETEFIKREDEKKKKEEERLKEEQEREKKFQQDKADFKNYCINKFGENLGNSIIEGRVLLGMSKEMCIAAWGNPIDINTTIVSGLTTEQWVYGWGTYLYFDNGLLTAIQK
jgi:hypothetical protein